MAEAEEAKAGAMGLKTEAKEEREAREKAEAESKRLRKLKNSAHAAKRKETDKSARHTPTKVVRFRTFKRPAPAASFGCCRFRSNFAGFASVPGRGLFKAGGRLFYGRSQH
jgi:hypothetical protein